jgi:hypothetical protein
MQVDDLQEELVSARRELKDTEEKIPQIRNSVEEGSIRARSNETKQIERHCRSRTNAGRSTGNVCLLFVWFLSV